MPRKQTRTLDEYKRKRDFLRTPEPQEKASSSASGRLFVVQKHRAQQLHYDLRLEYNGVLLSWAVPKGPSLDPSEKRLAVQVEDHPIEYGSFEGVIPEEEYGGGTVMLWDTGQWSELEEAEQAFANGTIKFKLHGQKLRGAWALIRLKEKGVPTRNWLLIKERDFEVRSEASFCIIDEEPFSAVSGRTIGEIAIARDRVWTAGGSQGATHERAYGWRRGLYRHVDLAPEKIGNAKKSAMPKGLDAIQPQESSSVPEGDGWIHEILQIGERALCWIEQNRVDLCTTSRKKLQEFPQIRRAASSLPVESALLDGVISASDTHYHIFDIVYCDGHVLTAAPLIERKQLLQEMLGFSQEPLMYCDHVEGHGDMVLAEAKRLGAAGIVSKKSDSTYAARKDSNWRVVHLTKEEELISRAKKRQTHSLVESEALVAGIKLSHPNRILYPEERVSKRMVAQYYEAIASCMIPLVRNRPLSIYRCPGGIEKECFFQKQLGEMSSRFLRGGAVDDEPYIVLDDAPGLVTLAQWNVLEIHDWGCLEKDMEHPDMMIFDLDPGPDVAWELIVEGAKGLRLLLNELALKSFVKTSGGKGLHVVVPLSAPAVKRKESSSLLFDQDWHGVKDFAARVSRRIVEVAPKHFTVMMSKPERKGKVFIDYLRNHRGSTCVAPYSTRARPGAFVSTPIHWDELSGPQPRFHIFQVMDRVGNLEDPWHDFLECRQVISPDAFEWLRGS